MNARTLESRNAGLMIRDGEARDKLVSAAIELAKDEQRQNQLKEQIAKLGITDADKRIAEEVLRQISNN